MTNKIITPGTLITRFNHSLKNLYDEKEIMQFLYMLFQHRLDWNKADLHLNRDTILDEEIVSYFNEALGQLSQNKPIQYIIGVTDFLGARIKVNPSVLIPRPETEELVSLIISDLKNINIASLSLLDIGTGSGCIAIAIKQQYQELDVHACDISEDALELAGINAAINHCDISFTRTDILDTVSGPLPQVSIIVSNPPYVRESDKIMLNQNVIGYEPHVALFVDDSDPLRFYKAIVAFALSHLIKPGMLYFEINELYGSQIKELLENNGFSEVAIFKDMSGKNRIIKAVMNL
jgi:release factor glutamine methyltransferase